jgi:hypothetical protein
MPRRFKVIQGPKSNTHATHSALFNYKQLECIGSSLCAPLSRSPTVSAPAVPGSLALILTSSAVGTASCPMTEHGGAQSVIQRQPVA